MKRTVRTENEWMAIIQECRASGLSDDQWCHEHGIAASSMYRNIRKLRSKACEIPKSVAASIAAPRQEVVPVCVTDLQEAAPAAANVSEAFGFRSIQDRIPAVRIRVGGASVEIMENADPRFVSAAVMALKSEC